ncbi:MAG: YbhB/YbcL family Raf kinase inhibitor-like protein [Brevinematales bacterium]|jgi:Raf kinase inhibitor-like YbhB/YbcL family protein
MDLIVKSTAFEEGQMIPSKYSCDRENFSPPLEWKNAPAGTAGFAVICDDPDAPVGTWVHWVIYNIPPDTLRLGEGIPLKPVLTDGSIQGINSFGHTGYGGPCPPGGTHRYYFKVYALSAVKLPQTGMNKDKLLSSMEGHILSSGSLMGKYSR